MCKYCNSSAIRCAATVEQKQKGFFLWCSKKEERKKVFHQTQLLYLNPSTLICDSRYCDVGAVEMKSELKKREEKKHTWIFQDKMQKKKNN